MKYEYKKEVPMRGIISEDRLNELGAEGWDHYLVNGNAHFFKRVVKIWVESTDIGGPANSPKTTNKK